MRHSLLRPLVSLANSQPWRRILSQNIMDRFKTLQSGVLDDYIKPLGISWLDDLVQKVTPREESWYKRHVKSYVRQKVRGLSPTVVASVGGSVVRVSVTEEVDGEYITNNNGSGVIVNPNGTIVTAFDLVANQRGWFGKKWTPKGKVTIGFDDNISAVANIVAANKDLGLAVLKIISKSPLKFVYVGRIVEYRRCHNVEWGSSGRIALVGTIRFGPRGVVHLDHTRFQNYYDINKDVYGGPVVDYHGCVVGISQKKPPKDDGIIIVTPILNVTKMVDCVQFV